MRHPIYCGRQLVGAMACTANPCGSAGGAGVAKLALACEKTDSIQSIAAVGIDLLNVPSCNVSFTTNPISTCNLTAVKQAIETVCVGQVSCEVNASDLIEAGACPAIDDLQVFARVDCLEETGLDLLTILILILYFVISFGLGATLNKGYFREIIRSKKRAFLVGWLSQFGFMPLMAFIMAKIFVLDNSSAVGVIL